MATKNPFQGDDVDPFSAARDPDTGEIKREPSPKPKAEPVNVNKPAAKETFKQAFARNRREGKATFTWNGRKYTTELAKPAAKSAPAKKAPAKPASPVRAEMQRNTASNAAANRERMEAQSKAREERKAKSSESKPLFGRNPKGKTPAEFRKEQGFAKGGSVRGYGIARGGKKCKMV